MVEDLARNIGKEDQMDMFILDCSKAFDKDPMVSRRKHWIGSSRGWKKNTIYCGSISTPVAVTSGVPQDTVLGPLMFLPYVNDKQEDLECTLRLFADDALLDHRITCGTETMALQRDLDELGLWAESCQMVYDPSK